ncbi:unnamed protein product [Leuciscus chuanchicus]
MEFIKEESEDMKIDETLKHKDTEEQTDPMLLEDEIQELNVIKEEEHDFITGENHPSCSQTEKTPSRKRARKAGGRRYFTCFQCGKSFSKRENLKAHVKKKWSDIKIATKRRVSALKRSQSQTGEAHRIQASS